MYKFMPAAMGLILWTAMPAVAGVGTTTFDFESSTPTAPPFGGALSSLTLTQDGLGLVIFREGGVNFDIADTTAIGSFPASWGGRALSPFNAETSPTAFIGNFSIPVSSVSIDMGDFGSDADDLLLEAYSGPNGTGTLLATGVGSLPGSTFDFTATSVSVSSASIASIRFIGGSTIFPHSVYYDNIAVVIPEPGTFTLLGVAGLVLLRRSR